ncbi:MAG TPA: GNAT family N-acetyltransferase [Gemmatimonadaceae bacterium]|nr:GNAT family N-acetyltransferase [Gemmatimonadaceae bacterium]
MISVREFKDTDYDSVTALWRAAAGVTLRDADERTPLTAYLARQPGLSFVAEEDGAIVGAVLCGTDGRRGYLQHLAVASTHRRRGIGRRLAESCTHALAARGIMKCHLMVVSDNDAARAFWMRLGWTPRDDVQLMSHTAGDSANA